MYKHILYLVCMHCLFADIICIHRCGGADVMSHMMVRGGLSEPAALNRGWRGSSQVDVCFRNMQGRRNNKCEEGKSLTSSNQGSQ